MLGLAGIIIHKGVVTEGVKGSKPSQTFTLVVSLRIKHSYSQGIMKHITIHFSQTKLGVMSNLIKSDRYCNKILHLLPRAEKLLLIELHCRKLGSSFYACNKQNETVSV